MKIMVIGCGMMGRAVIWDLVKQEKTLKIIAVDSDPAQIKSIRTFLKNISLKSVEFHCLDLRNSGKLAPLFKEADTVISAVTYRHNFELAKMAVRYGCNFCDLGGNNTIVQKQLGLHAAAMKKGITVIPDCGLAPGMVSVLTAHAFQNLDRTDEVKIRVGGLPVHPKSPMNYQIVFSVHGLINEYAEPCVQLSGGKKIVTQPMEDLETLTFPKPFGRLEAFNTSGGSSTLPDTFKGKIRDLDYKTIRYPGHCEQFLLLMNLGLTSLVPEKYETTSLVPRTILAHHLTKTLSGNDQDTILLRVTARGLKNKKPKTIIYELIDYGEIKNKITAMMRMTAFPAAIIAQMMTEGEIRMKGAVPQELAVPPERFIREIRKRGIDLKIKYK